MSLIEVKEVSKVYHALPVLEEVSLAVEEGDLYGIVGQSGSGKTTLLNILTGFIPPSEGKVFFSLQATEQPKILTQNLHQLKKHLGFMPQHNAFYPRLTVKENLFHFGKLYGLQQATLVENAKSLLQFTQLFEHRNKLAEHLSEGMQRRLDLACSLIHKPRLLVLDEPTADLDPRLQEDILQLLQQVNQQGITIIMASHHLEGVENICNKVAIIHRGRVHTSGLLDDIKKPFLKEKLTINVRPGSNKQMLLDTLRKLPVEKIVDRGNQLVIYPADIERTINSLLHLIKEENLYLNDMDVRKPSLHEIFNRITAS